ncbi:MAG: SpoIIIAH-like family protein [Firmicutes bacterium]|jgi:stage III sporulation protein AH|nr:SpoIIIAH-like family protein [Bacillota bacterium]MDH7495070.1 SpoIIIAH-like family protein [Bacillota bacterium]
MKDRARSGFALMVVVAVVLGVLIGTRNVQAPPEGAMDSASGGDVRQAAALTGGEESGSGLVTPDATKEEANARAGLPAVSETNTTGDDFFAEYRLERTRARSRSIELLQQVLADESASEEAREAASAELVDLSKKTDAESEAEALIRARGYEDALVFVRGDTCDVVVSGPELTRSDAEQIGDIVSRCLGVELANITIVERGK